MAFTKKDIDFHGDGNSSAFGGGTGYPAVNVKSQGSIFFEIEAAFPELGKEKIERIGGMAWDTHAELFWQVSAPSILGDIFPEVKPEEWTQAGRSGGWLVVTGLGDQEFVLGHWNAPTVARWGKFERAILAEVQQLSNTDSLIETIKANEWDK